MRRPIRLALVATRHATFRIVRTAAAVLVAACVVAAVDPARGDVVHLKSGGKVTGEVVEETATTVVVKIDGGRVSLDRAQVASIEKAPVVAPVPADGVVGGPRDAAPPMSIRKGPHFRVTCHFVSDAFADEALAAAEASWTATLATLGVDPVPLDRPLDIHVCRTVAEIDALNPAIAARLEKPRYTGFTDADTHAAFIVLRSAYDDAVWRRLGAPALFLTAVVHEASHQTVLTCMPNGGALPPWLAEGLAQHAEQQVLLARRWSPDAASDLRTSAEMVACIRLRREGLLPEPRAILQDRLGHLSVFDRYSVLWAFLEFLLRPAQRERTGALLRGMREAAAGADLAPRLAAMPDALWDAKGLDDLNDAFRKHVDTFRPVWDVQGMMQVLGEAWVEWAPDADTPSYAWRVASAGSADYRITGSFEFLAGGVRQASVNLGRGDAGFVSVILDANDGVWVSEFRTADNAWHEIEGEVCEPAAIGTKSEFEIRVSGDAIRVRLGGKDAAVVTARDRDLSGPWGVGVHSGTTAVMWTGVKLE